MPSMLWKQFAVKVVYLFTPASETLTYTLYHIPPRPTITQRLVEIHPNSQTSCSLRNQQITGKILTRKEKDVRKRHTHGDIPLGIIFDVLWSNSFDIQADRMRAIVGSLLCRLCRACVDSCCSRRVTHRAAWLASLLHPRLTSAADNMMTTSQWRYLWQTINYNKNLYSPCLVKTTKKREQKETSKIHKYKRARQHLHN